MTLTDYKNLFARLKTNCGIKVADFEVNTYDRDEDRPTYHDQYITQCFMDGDIFVFITEADGYLFTHEWDLLTREDIFGEDIDEVALDYIYNEIYSYYLGEYDD